MHWASNGHFQRPRVGWEVCVLARVDLDPGGLCAKLNQAFQKPSVAIMAMALNFREFTTYLNKLQLSPLKKLAREARELRWRL